MQGNDKNRLGVAGFLSDLVLNKLSPEQALLVIDGLDKDSCLSDDLDLLIALERFVALEGDSVFLLSPARVPFPHKSR
jgi:hypothetical protein